MPRYSNERKAAVLSKLLPPNNQPVTDIAASEGISEATLYNWLNQARNEGIPVPGSRASNTEQWSGEAKFAAVLETQPMNEAEKGAYCARKVCIPSSSTAGGSRVLPVPLVARTAASPCATPAVKSNA